MKRSYEEAPVLQSFKKLHLDLFDNESQFKTNDHLRSEHATVQQGSTMDDVDDLGNAIVDNTSEQRMIPYNPYNSSDFSPIVASNILKIIKNYSIEELRQYINSQDFKTKEYLKYLLSKNPFYANFFNRLVQNSCLKKNKVQTNLMIHNGPTNSQTFEQEYSNNNKIQELEDDSTLDNSTDSDSMMLDSDYGESSASDEDNTSNYIPQYNYYNNDYFSAETKFTNSYNSCFNSAYPTVVNYGTDNDLTMIS